MTNGNIPIATALKNAVAKLSENSTIETPRLDAEVLLCHILKCDRVFLVVNSDKTLTDKEFALFSEYINRRKENEPVSYITGVREFMSLEFNVSKGVLIPRPDTEILVEILIEKYNGKDVKFLDLCTGSGAIAVSLLFYLKDAKCTAVDKYDICVKTTLKNAKKHNTYNRLTVINDDILSGMDYGTEFDCIVSNPPYIETQTLDTLLSDVKDFEPLYALDGGNDGLIFYRKITDYASKTLSKGGVLALEIGYNQGQSVKRILEETNEFDSIEVFCDLAGLDRVIIAEKR